MKSQIINKKDFLSSNFLNKISEYKNCLITGHQNVDGDSLGSALALGEIVRKKIKNTDIVFPDNKFLPKYAFLLDAFETPLIGVQKKVYDLVIICDCSDIKRIGEIKNHLHKSKLIINIDHHSDNSKFGQINHVKNSSSVGEILYDLFEIWGVKITKKIALALALSIVTDTGRFRYDNCTTKTFEIFSNLMKIKFGFSSLMRNLYDSHSLMQLGVRKEALHNLVVRGNIGYSFIDRQVDDTDGLVEMIRAIDIVDIAFFMKPSEDGYKISIRSKSMDYNVQEIAHIMRGGGHPLASGATLKVFTAEDARRKVFRAIKRWKKQKL